MSSQPDPLSGNTPPSATPATSGRAKIICEFCKCQLTPTGDALVISDSARAYRGLEDKNLEMSKTITKLEGEKAELERRIRELTPAPASGSRGFVL